MKPATWDKHLITNLPLVLSLCSLILHSVGVYFLSHRLVRTRNQDLIILNLSVSEIGMNVLDILQNVDARQRRPRTHCYVVIANCCLFAMPYLCFLLLLTMDRYFEVRMNIKYALHFTRRKTNALVAGVWIIGGVLFACMVYLRYAHRVKVRLLFFKTIFPLYETAFLVLATPVYVYIYRQFRRAKILPGMIAKKQPPRRRGGIRRRKVGKVEPIKQRLCARNFFAPSFIVLTFVLFVVLPDIVNLVCVHLPRAQRKHTRRARWRTENILLSLYACGYTADAVIYVFLQRKVYALFKRKFSRNSVVVTSSTSATNENN